MYTSQLSIPGLRNTSCFISITIETHICNTFPNNHICIYLQLHGNKIALQNHNFKNQIVLATIAGRTIMPSATKFIQVTMFHLPKELIYK